MSEPKVTRENEHLEWLNDRLKEEYDRHSRHYYAIKNALIEHGAEVERPTIVCLCGSTRFMDAFRRASLEETLGGKIVLSIGCDLRDSGFETFTQEHLAEIKVELDELHLRKIDLADEVFILNVGGYIGKSTRNELNYAKEKGKRIRFLELPDVYPTLR